MTYDRNKEIMRLFDAGLSYSDIASRIGVTRSIVAGVVYRNRKDDPDFIYGSGRAIIISDGSVRSTVQELAKKHGISRHKAYYRARYGLMGWSK